MLESVERADDDLDDDLDDVEIDVAVEYFTEDIMDWEHTGTSADAHALRSSLQSYIGVQIADCIVLRVLLVLCCVNFLRCSSGQEEEEEEGQLVFEAGEEGQGGHPEGCEIYEEGCREGCKRSGRES